MLPSSLSKEVSVLLSGKTGSEVSIIKTRPLSGGSINKAFFLDTTIGRYFLKYNHASAYPGMFEQEAKGLGLLQMAGEIRVPQSISCGEAANYSFLLLEYIDATEKRDM